MSNAASTLRVFISYAHDSEAHRERVVNLAQRMRDDGIDTQIDRFVTGSPAEGWPAWMEHQVRKADFVLIVGSPAYLRRYEGRERQGVGLGATWEAVLARQDLYEGQGINRKFVPVVFDRARIAGQVPKPLRAHTHYRLPGQYQALLRALAGQPEVVPKPLGPLRLSGASLSVSGPPVVENRSLSRVPARYKADVLRYYEALTGSSLDSAVIEGARYVPTTEEFFRWKVDAFNSVVDELDSIYIICACPFLLTPPSLVARALTGDEARAYFKKLEQCVNGDTRFRYLYTIPEFKKRNALLEFGDKLAVFERGMGRNCVPMPDMKILHDLMLVNSRQHPQTVLFALRPIGSQNEEVGVIINHKATFEELMSLYEHHFEFALKNQDKLRAVMCAHLAY